VTSQQRITKKTRKKTETTNFHQSAKWISITWPFDSLCHFSLVVHWNQASISNYFRDIQPQQMLNKQTNKPTHQRNGLQCLQVEVTKYKRSFTVLISGQHGQADNRLMEEITHHQTVTSSNRLGIYFTSSLHLSCLNADFPVFCKHFIRYNTTNF